MTMEQTECSKTLAYKIKMLGNYPEESIQHSEHGESLKSRTKTLLQRRWNAPNDVLYGSNRFTDKFYLHAHLFKVSISFKATVILLGLLK